MLASDSGKQNVFKDQNGIKQKIENGKKRDTDAHQAHAGHSQNIKKPILLEFTLQGAPLCLNV